MVVLLLSVMHTILTVVVRHERVEIYTAVVVPGRLDYTHST